MNKHFDLLKEQALQRNQDLNSMIQIRVGSGICGESVGAQEILNKLNDKIISQSLPAIVYEVGCIGLCYAEPLVDIQKPGESRVFFKNVTEETIDEIIDSISKDIWSPSGSILGTLGNLNIDGIPQIEEMSQWKFQTRIATRNCGTNNPNQILDYIATGGYEGLAKAISTMSPEEVRNEVAVSGLRGRGGAAFPTATKWGFLVNAPGPDKYILVNCEEGDPGAYNDKGILESDPHTLIEGAAIAGFATGANKGYVFIRHGHTGPIERTREGIKQAYTANLLGNNILGSDFSFELEVALVGESYVSGEETALMEAIEGKRAMPRSRPPFPAAVGVFGRPSNINNVKTLSYTPEIIRKSGKWFAGIGYGRSTGTAILCLNGNVKFPGMYEVAFGITIGKIVEEISGGAPEKWNGITLNRSVKLLQTGGPLGGVLGRESLETLLDYESMAATGAILGSGGIIVGDDTVCAVDLVRNLVAFCQFESCGKCFPCRLGMTHLVEVLERISAGGGTPNDLKLMPTVGNTMAKGSLCGHGQLGFNPISSALRYFSEDFRIHIEEGRCPTGSCIATFHRPTRTRPIASSGWYPGS
jgi:NADH-quinone oxidoreductase subunit F